MPSGGRLEMVTDATVLELDVHAHAACSSAPNPDPPAAFDLVVDGELAAGESHAHRAR